MTAPIFVVPTLSLSELTNQNGMRLLFHYFLVSLLHLCICLGYLKQVLELCLYSCPTSVKTRYWRTSVSILFGWTIRSVIRLLKQADESEH